MQNKHIINVAVNVNQGDPRATFLESRALLVDVMQEAIKLPCPWNLLYPLSITHLILLMSLEYLVGDGRKLPP